MGANEMELTLDLTPSELVVVTMLASLGEAVMAGDKVAGGEVAGMLMKEEGIEQIAQTALDKLHASLKLAKTMMQDSSPTVPTVVS